MEYLHSPKRAPRGSSKVKLKLNELYNVGWNAGTWPAPCSCAHSTFSVSGKDVSESLSWFNRDERGNNSLQVREENPILYSHKTQLNIKLSLLQQHVSA